jgi:hypothetical protein
LDTISITRGFLPASCNCQFICSESPSTPKSARKAASETPASSAENAHEEQLGLRIAKLRRVDDVAAVIGQEARDAMHDAALVQAGQGKNVFRVSHE